MGMPKGESPYTRLMAKINDHLQKIREAQKTTGMWTYPKKELRDGRWSLEDLYQRVAAAKQLKHDVVLLATDNGLEVCYRPQTPSQFDW